MQLGLLLSDKVTGSDTGIMTNRSTLPRLSISAQEFMDEHTGLEVLFFYSGDLLSQTTGPYGNIPKEVPTIRGEIAEIIIVLISILKQVARADHPFGNIRMLIDLLKLRSVRLS